MNRQFPPEIVQLIVEASLDPYDLFTPSERAIESRYATLKPYSLLNSTWYGVSQPELVRSVALYKAGSVEQFLEMAERRGGTVDGVRDLYIEQIQHGNFSTLPRLFRSTPHLLNLLCCGGTMVVGDLAQLQRLRRLRFVSMNVFGSPASSLLCLPHLEQLSMNQFSVLNSASHFLTPASLPQLRRIDTDRLARTTPLVQQLKIVTIESDTRMRGYGDYTLLAPAKSLLLLPLPEYSRDRLAIFTNLPSLPPFLHINFYPGTQFSHEVAVALEEVLGANKPGLRIILLNNHGIDDRIRSLIQQLKERGIRVQMVDKRLDFDGAIVEMYRIRAKEERAKEDEQGKEDGRELSQGRAVIVGGGRDLCGRSNWGIEELVLAGQSEGSMR